MSYEVIMLEFEGKVAVVTGAARGIGRATSLTLAERGADITAIDLREEMAIQAAKEVEGLGRKALAVPMDVSSSKSVAEGFAKIMETFGRIDILVNCAGIDIPGKLVDMSEENWDKTMNVNLKSVFLCAKAVAPIMMEQKSGKIVSISSIAGKLGEDTQGAYCCSKAGVGMLTQVLALELAPYNITVNAVCPGKTETEMIRETAKRISKEQNVSLEEFEKMWLDAVPLHRYARPCEVAELIAFLSSNKSDYITGISVTIAGGSLLY